jgi:hypothetical protein
MITAQISEFRPAGGRDVVPSAVAQSELARQCGLDRLPEQRRLVCHWHRDGEGRLAGVWEADIGLVPQL